MKPKKFLLGGAAMGASAIAGAIVLAVHKRRNAAADTKNTNSGQKNEPNSDAEAIVKGISPEKETAAEFQNPWKEFSAADDEQNYTELSEPRKTVSGSEAELYQWEDLYLRGAINSADGEQKSTKHSDTEKAVPEDRIMVASRNLWEEHPEELKLAEEMRKIIEKEAFCKPQMQYDCQNDFRIVMTDE